MMLHAGDGASASKKGGGCGTLKKSVQGCSKGTAVNDIGKVCMVGKCNDQRNRKTKMQLHLTN